MSCYETAKRETSLFNLNQPTNDIYLPMFHISSADIMSILGPPRVTKHRIVCTNCGKTGHEYKACKDPISSFGVINIDILPGCLNESLYTGHENEVMISKYSTKKSGCRVFSQKYPDIECILNETPKSDMMIPTCRGIRLRTSKSRSIRADVQKIVHYQHRVLFMMVSRKYSLGYIEFLRGKYRVTDSNAIIRLFEQMYQSEIESIRTTPYDDLIYQFSNRDNESRETVLHKLYHGRYSVVYCEAKIKFEMLRNPSAEQLKLLPATLEFYTTSIKPTYFGPEWGFPKGRRDEYSEDNITCARREFQEETGYTSSDYAILNRVEPLEEIMEGTNGIPYKHVYYLGINQSQLDPSELERDSHEIGSVAWFNYQEAMEVIRPYHINKKVVLTQAFMFIINTLVTGDLSTC